MSINKLSVFLLTIGSLGMVGCSKARLGQSGKRETTLPNALRNHQGSEMVLSIYAVQDSIHRGDSLIVGTLLQNSGNARRFRNDPELLHFDVIGPSEKKLGADLSRWREWNLGERPNLEIPRGGILGQLSNLSCRSQPFAPLDSDDGCIESIHLQEFGSYKIVARLEEIRVDVGKVDNVQGLHLTSDTLRIIYTDH